STLSFRNTNPSPTLPNIGAVTGPTTYTLILDNTSIPVNLVTATLAPGVTAFNYSAGGDHTQTGAINVPGLTTPTSTAPGDDSILHNSFANNIATVGFNAPKGDNTTQVSYRGSAAVMLNNCILGLGTFNITAAGNITQGAPGNSIVQKIGAGVSPNGAPATT